jgi:hypothetical protein
MALSIKDILPGLKPTQSLTLNGSYSVNAGDKYENIASTYQTVLATRKADNVFGCDITGFDRLDMLAPLAIESGDARRISLTRNTNTRLSTKWSMFDWIKLPERFSMINRLSPSANYSESIGDQDTTGTRVRTQTTEWPDVVVGTSDLEKLIGISKVLTNSQINYQTKTKTIRTFNQDVDMTHQVDKLDTYSANFTLFKDISLSGSYSKTFMEMRNLRTNKLESTTNKYDYTLSMSGTKLFTWRGIRFTPKFGFGTNTAVDGDPSNPDPTQSTKKRDIRTRTIGVQAYADATLPSGLVLPLIGKTLPLTNRLIFNGNFDWANREGDAIADNTDQYNLTASVQYEISQNLRADVSAGCGWYTGRKDSSQDNYTVTFKSMLNIVF